jgi:hypothetical protein
MFFIQWFYNLLDLLNEKINSIQFNSLTSMASLSFKDALCFCIAVFTTAAVIFNGPVRLLL